MAIQDKITAANIKRFDKLLLILFAFAFFAKLLERLSYLFSLASRPLNFGESYALTEWLINYSGGFVRRGWPGEILNILYKTFAVPPNLSITLITVVIYIVYAVIVWTKGRSFIPSWAILSAPLIGYPIYMDKIFLRKDIFVLLLLILAIVLVTNFHSIYSDLLSSATITLLILCHEIGFFLAFAPVAGLMILRYYSIQGLKKSLLKALPSLSWLCMPLSALAAVFLNPGTDRIATSVASSWRAAYDPKDLFPGPIGALAWLTPDARINTTTQAQLILNENYHGIPYWLIILLALASGTTLLFLAICQRSSISASYFLICVSLQTAGIFPLITGALDQARFTILALNSAFLITIFTPLNWQERLCRAIPTPCAIQFKLAPYWIAPLGLCFWGLPFSSWSLYGWLSSSPFGLILQIYFYLRVWHLIPSISMP